MARELFLCCGSCLGPLIAAGGHRVAGERVVSLLDRCEAHPRGGEHTQAMHSVMIERAAVELLKSEDETLPSPLPDSPDRALLATLATTLLAGVGCLDFSREDVELSVRLARTVLAAVEKSR